MKRIINRYKCIIKTIYGFSKVYIFTSIFSKLFTLVNTYIVLFVNKLIINTLSIAIFSEETDVVSIIKLLLVSSIIELATLLLFNFLQFRIGKLKLEYDDKIAISLAESLSNLDMSYYDDPASYNQTRQAGKCQAAILDGYNALLNFVFNVFSFIVALSFAIKFNILVTALAIVSVIPTMIIKRKISTRRYNVEKEITPNQRFTDYLLAMFYNRSVEMEMQLYGFKNYIAEKIKQKQKKTRDIRIQESLSAAKKEALLAVVNKFFKIVQQLLIILTIINRKLSIGDYSYYGGVVGNLAASVTNIVKSINSMHLNNVKYDEYMQITSRKPQIVMDGTTILNSLCEFTIEFDHVSFRYPHTNQNIITDVCLKIKSGEKIAFVGENGAGKTTLVKLLLRFYDPSDGRILLNGIDIRQYDLVSYRRLFSAMFQESLLYLLSIKENIVLSDLALEDEDAEDRVNKILEELHFDQINGEPIDFNRHYGREFDQNGYVFSKGQQQKLQSARMLFRNSSFYILDEPVASMDIISEAVFLKTLMQHAKSKTVMYITHRYNNLDTMDNIFVLSNGQIIEQGDHRSLINKKGLYAKMFTMQVIDNNT